MRLAYIISAYKYPQQLARLVRRLHTDASSFFIHIDKRAGDGIALQVARGLSDLPNIHLLERHECYWGGFGHVEATLKGIDALLASRCAFDYAILLTGQDYPIKPNERIEGLLWEGGEKMFMDYFALPYDGWKRGGMERIQYWHFRRFAKYWRLLAQLGYDAKKSRSPLSYLLSFRPVQRRFPKGYRPFGGSSYWCLPRICLEYLQNFVEGNPSFVRFFKHVDVPDETFFQTILLNSPLGDRVICDDLRYIDWKDPDAGSPSILGKGDFERIRRSSKLFARKFDATVDSEIMDMIDRDMLRVEG